MISKTKKKKYSKGKSTVIRVPLEFANYLRKKAKKKNMSIHEYLKKNARKK